MPSIRKEARARLDAMLATPPTPATDAQIRDFLLAANAREISPEELAGYADALRAASVPIEWGTQEDGSSSAPQDFLRESLSSAAPAGLAGKTEGIFASLTDTCGTGGDRCNTFNISTAAALLASACGVPVAKHGNRSATSKCGSADVLEQLGIPMRGPQDAACALREYKFAFLFAPAFHPAMARVASIRRAIGVPTFFNLLGPLANPARARRQLIGTWSVAAVRLLAATLALLDAEHVLVVHASDGLDEITLTGPTFAAEVLAGKVRELTITPQDFGMSPHLAQAPYAGDETAAENADMIRRIFSANVGCIYHREIVLANAAAVLHVAGLAASLADGIKLASDTLSSGRAAAHLGRLQED